MELTAPSPPTANTVLPETVALRRIYPSMLDRAWPLIVDCLDRCYPKADDKLRERTWLSLKSGFLKAFSLGGTDTEGKEQMLAIVITVQTLEAVTLERTLLIWAISDIQKLEVPHWLAFLDSAKRLARNLNCDCVAGYSSNHPFINKLAGLRNVQQMRYIRLDVED